MKLGLWGKGLSIALWLAWLPGCDGGGPTTPSECPEENVVWGECAGVPAGAVCDAETCAEGVDCASIDLAATDAELATKAAAASAGTCITLAPGSYAAVTLPGGVSLLGRSADDVKVAGLVLDSGEGAVVRGVGVGAGGIEVNGATGVRIESVRITGDAATFRDGIALHDGAEATIVTTTIASAGRVGVDADGSSVFLHRTIVSGGAYGGVWAQGPECAPDCQCPERPAVGLTSSVLRDNAYVGLVARGVSLTLEGTDITATASVESGPLIGEGGLGVSVDSCSIAAAKRVRVLDNLAWGVLVDGATAALGGEGEDETIEISGNEARGLWIQNVSCGTGQCVTLHHGTLDGNLGVGIGVSGSAQGVILCKTAVTGTKAIALSVENGTGDSPLVGDGIDWLDGSDVTIEEVTLAGNERQSLLIDGPVTKGTIKSLILSDGDGDRPPLQQRVMEGDGQPANESGVPLATDPTAKLSVPMKLTTLATP